MHPVDELGQVRAEMAALKARENELRATLAMQRRDLSGGRFEARFEHHAQRVFLVDRLPDYILNAPELWEERHSMQLRLEEKASADDAEIVVESWRQSA